MGNCVYLCNRNISKIKGDIIINNLDNKPEKIIEQNNMKKIIFAPKIYQKIFKKIKSKKKYFIKNKNNNSDNNTKQSVSQSEKEIKLKLKILNDSTKKTKNSSKIYIKNSKYITYDEEPSTELLIPTINTPLIERNIFKDDLSKKNRKKQNNNGYNNKNNNLIDPRELPIDGIHRKYPKIIEDKCAYEGEWKDGKRDGYGILSWKNKSKFIGNFEDDKVIGFGILCMMKEIYIKVIGKNFNLKE